MSYLLKSVFTNVLLAALMAVPLFGIEGTLTVTAAGTVSARNVSGIGPSSAASTAVRA